MEFEDPHDAEDAFNEMHGRRIDGYTISVQVSRLLEEFLGLFKHVILFIIF